MELIGPNEVIDTLSTKACAGNKTLQGKVRKIMQVQEETSFIEVD